MEIEINSCRICFKNIGTISVFGDHGNENPAEIISSLYNLNIIREVNLPNTICIKCMEFIKLAVQTKQNIINSEIILNKYLESNSTIGIADDTFMQKSEQCTPKCQVIGLDVKPLNIKVLEDESKTDVLPIQHYMVLENHTSESLSILPKNYNCKRCEFKTDTYKRVLCHMRLHSDIKLYECELCGREYTTENKYREHVRVSHSVAKYICNFCCKSFKGKPNLKQHLLTHKTERIFPCPNCDKSFCHMKGLNAHLLTHNERNLVCEHCGKLFKHTTFLKMHKIKEHYGSYRKLEKQRQPLTVQRVPCEYCAELISINALKRHITTKHTKERKYQCTVCDKNFALASNLNLHMQRHTDPTINRYMKHKCDQCEKEFTAPYYLKKHKIIHSGVKEHVCSHCGKEFAFKVYLERHVRLNHDTTNPRNFICNTCGKISVDSSAFKVHMLAHTGETPYHCKVCDSKFVYAKSLRIHVSKKHSENKDINI